MKAMGPHSHCLSPVVLQLLQGEDVFVEIFLEFLICIVNVKLLKTIHLQEETIIKFYILVPKLWKNLYQQKGRCQAWSKAREHSGGRWIYEEDSMEGSTRRTAFVAHARLIQ